MPGCGWPDWQRERKRGEYRAKAARAAKKDLEEFSLKYISKSDLVRRGWTQELIDKYLKKPDLKYENRFGTESHYFKKARAFKLEDTVADISARIQKKSAAKSAKNEYI